MLSLIKLNTQKRTAVISFTMEDLDPTLVIAPYLFCASKILVRSGLHCAPLIHKAIGTYPQGTTRISFSKFTTTKDIDILLSILKKLSDEVSNES